MSFKKIYLDYNATTPLDERVLAAMLPYFTEMYGNASSDDHVYGWDAQEAVSFAREQVADLIGCGSGEITFTSGATEAVNIGLLGFCQANRKKGNHVITCATEHKAVLDTCHQLEAMGFRVTYLPVDETGNIDLHEFRDAITDQTILVSLMLANNETGVIHPIRRISEITQAKEIALMTDATQAIGKLDIDLHQMGVDIAAFSGHKIYGPKGVGALYIAKKPQPNIQPIQYGGGQERSLRPGTLNVPGIVGMGEACQILTIEQKEEIRRLSRLRDQLEQQLRSIEGIRINGGNALRIPNTTNISIDNIVGSQLLRQLKSLAVSQGSACNSITVNPSHVLKSMGVREALALSSIRISVGRFTTKEEIEVAGSQLVEVTTRLRLATS